MVYDISSFLGMNGGDSTGFKAPLLHQDMNSKTILNMAMNSSFEYVGIHR